MKLIKITNKDGIIYESDCGNYGRISPEYRKIQLNTLKSRSINVFFNDNIKGGLISINGPFHVRIKEDIKCYNEWEVHPTQIEKGTKLFIEVINISFGITKYMLGFQYLDSGSNAIHYIDPEYVDIVEMECEKKDPEPEIKKVTKSKSNDTKPKTKTKSKTTSRKTKSTTTVKNTNISKNIKNMCDIGKPGFTLDDEELKKLNESINDNVNKLCVFIERKNKVNKIISALSESSKNIKLSDSNYYFNVKIISLDLDINIPSDHLFDTKDINKLILDYHKKEYDSIKEEIGILKGMIFRDLDILLTGEEK